MKILQIVSSSRISGAEKHVLILSRALRELGHEITIVCPPGGWVPEQLKGAGLDVMERPLHGSDFLKTHAELVGVIKRDKYQLVHSHLTNATYHAYLLSKRLGIPAVCSVHVRSRDLVYCKLFPKKNRTILTVSNWVQEGFTERGVPRQHLRTVYNGTDILEEPAHVASPTLYQELGLLPESLLVGIFGHVGEFKGHRLLCQIWGEVVAASPRAHLVCVGNIKDEERELLEGLLSQGGGLGHVHFLGHRNDVPSLMQQMIFTTLPSQYEACSMAIIESMASERAVVASQAGGNPELIETGVNGLLVQRNASALRDGLVELLNDAGRRQELAGRAKQTAVDRFSAKSMATGVEEIYTKLVGK